MNVKVSRIVEVTLTARDLRKIILDFIRAHSEEPVPANAKITLSGKLVQDSINDPVVVTFNITERERAHPTESPPPPPPPPAPPPGKVEERGRE